MLDFHVLSIKKNIEMNTEKSITKQEIKYWLGNDYHKWIVNVIHDLVNLNDPNDLLYLKKEIKKASQDSKDAK